MAKISLPNVQSGYVTTTQLNAALQAIQAEFQNKVLYRDNPVNEPNQMENNLDMNGFAILNSLAVSGDNFLWMGTWTTGEEYLQNNLVYVDFGTYTGYTMIALQDHTAGADFDTDFAADKWAILAQKGDQGSQGIQGQAADEYLGAQASDPLTRPNTSALEVGDLYFNTTLERLKVYNGTTWEFAVLIDGVQKTSDTGSAVLPVGTTAQRDGGAPLGYFRYNSELGKFEGYSSLGWGSVGGGATGGGQDETFVENDNLITQSYVIGQGAQKSGVTVDAGTNVFNLTGHGFTENQLVFFMTSGTLPAPLEQYVGYYVIASGLTADAFKLSETLGGAEINITDTGTGAYTVGKVKNAISAGKMVTADGVTVTIPTGAFYTTV